MRLTIFLDRITEQRSSLAVLLIPLKKYVQARNAGQLIRQGQYERRPKATDKFAGVIEEAVDKSKAKVRAKAIHVRLVALGYNGSIRSTRRAVATAKVAWRKSTQRIFWPWIAEMGKWAQYDFSSWSCDRWEKDHTLSLLSPFL
ncbi:hypothetical protein [Acidithrix sp. C25]|uniref:hypothetical protein n=1 Tax=Acidithrix sp. C25 TaxID=1671482 RepID=UPI00191BBE0E|nr:hypothetical protein [Acidithrix sp. C25]CAG4905846.1 unnamed protein product [Acidithrix sp. C25]CAG4930252.1 unnamed protein product [Acidithrix sp. C25]CAG4933586.1 unnamed protein product [Acidithrix sp. C25]